MLSALFNIYKSYSGGFPLTRGPLPIMRRCSKMNKPLCIQKESSTPALN